MVRRLTLVGLLVLAQGTLLQLLMGTFLAALFLLLQVQVSPYTSLADDFVASAASFALVIVFLCALSFKLYEFVGLPDIEGKMSDEQQSYYIINQLTVTIIMLCSILGTIIASALTLFIQVGVEVERSRRMARASRARRLRYKVSHDEVHAPALEGTHQQYHTFLSHVWGTGQDQMRIVKQRLLEMIPDLVIFLDVDDLEEIGDLESYIKRTSTVLIYCSRGYFTSKNCMIELCASISLMKPLITLSDPDESRGGMNEFEVHTQLFKADALCTKWGFEVEAEVELEAEEAAAVAEGAEGGGSLPTKLVQRLSAKMNHGGSMLNDMLTTMVKTVSSGELQTKSLVWPGGQNVYDYLMSTEPIEWNRIGHFQDVTMRLIAERLLGEDAAGTTYVDRELISLEERIPPLRPPRGRHSAFHIYCSPLNPGALDLLREVGRERGFTVRLDSPPSLAAAGGSDGAAAADALADAAESNVLFVTTDRAKMPRCDHMLLYLTALTWTRGSDVSEQLAEELAEAMALEDTAILLCHEMPGKEEAARHGCEFGAFFACADGATPSHLLQKGLYSTIAVPMKGGAWRHVSLVLMGRALGLSKDEMADPIEAEGLLESSTKLLRRHSFSVDVLRQVTIAFPASVQRVSRRFHETAGRKRSVDCTADHTTAAADSSHTLDPCAAGAVEYA